MRPLMRSGGGGRGRRQYSPWLGVAVIWPIHGKLRGLLGCYGAVRGKLATFQQASRTPCNNHVGQVIATYLDLVTASRYSHVPLNFAKCAFFVLAAYPDNSPPGQFPTIQVLVLMSGLFRGSGPIVGSCPGGK